MLDSVEQQAVAWAEQVLVSAEQVLVWAGAGAGIGGAGSGLGGDRADGDTGSDGSDGSDGSMVPMATRKAGTMLLSSPLTTGIYASTILSSRRKGRTS